MKKLKINDKLVNNLIQFIFIFSSVYFAFWLSNLAEEKKVKKIEKRAIESIYKELKENLAQLNEAYEFHDEIREKLFMYADSVEKKFIDPASLKPNDHLSKIFTRQSNSLGFPKLNSDAWETMKISEAYGRLDYALASAMGKLYRAQKIGVETTMHEITTQIFNSKSVFNREESEAVIFLTAWSFRELAGQEQYLRVATAELIMLIEEYYPDQKIRN